MPSRVESVEVPDGTFALPVWLPDAGSGPGLLLIQEIFGISDYIRAVAEDLAGLGYVVAAPDLFWRIEPGFDAKHDQEGLAKSLEMGQRFDAEQGVADSVAALGHLKETPRGRGRHRRHRVLPRRDGRLLRRRADRGCRAGLVLRLGRAGQPRDPRADQRPGAVPVRRQRRVHSPGPGGARRSGRGRQAERGGPRRGGSRARVPQPQVPDVPRARRRRTGRGSAPRSSCSATSPPATTWTRRLPDRPRAASRRRRRQAPSAVHGCLVPTGLS